MCVDLRVDYKSGEVSFFEGVLGMSLANRARPDAVLGDKSPDSNFGRCLPNLGTFGRVPGSVGLGEHGLLLLG